MTDYTRRQCLRDVGLGAVALTLPGRARGSQTPAAGRPNIIFMMADDLGYGHLGCYGQEKIRTPHLDRLAAGGVRFTQTYSGCTVCAPSRSVLMTGRHGGHTSVRGNSGGIPLLDEDVTVGEVLQQAGYTTGVFGKWGLGDAGTSGVPNKQGFDAFFGYLHQVHCHFYYPYFLWENETKYLLPGNEGGKRQQYSHDVIVGKALEFMRAHRAGPFFLYLAFTIPHTEHLVPEDSFREYAGQFPEPSPYVDARKHYADQPAARATFAAMVTRMDRDVGRVMSVLRDLAIEENTIVFFTSDNGGQPGGGADVEFFRGNGPLRAGKGSMYDGGIRVPMLVRWPGKITPGQVNDHVWAFYDVMPTLAELAGATPAADTDGISALPAILGAGAAGRPQELHRFLYWEQGTGRRLQQAVRMGDWKTVRQAPGTSLELYNLRDDIGETTDVAGAHPDVVAAIEEYLTTARTEPRDYGPPDQSAGLPALETGYVR